MPRAPRIKQNDQPWPSCPTCDGPARPVGEPAFRVRFEVETRSEANARDKWGKIKRAEAAREKTIEALAVALGEGQRIPGTGPWCVRLTRISRGKLDDDNLGRAMKSVQDTVAAAIGVDDGSPRIAWKRAQTKDGPFLGVVVEIWSANIS
jgi:hypothetical protein